MFKKLKKYIIKHIAIIAEAFVLASLIAVAGLIEKLKPQERLDEMAA